jgi:hypothetical protein
MRLDLAMRSLERFNRNPNLTAEARVYLFVRYADLARQSRRINIAEWEQARLVAERWKGQPAELLVAAKVLAGENK